MTIGLLRIAEAVGRTRSVSRAADDLGVSQPRVSIGLSRLRQQIGDPLFVRTGAGMTPTPTGERVLEAARQTLALLSEAFDRGAGEFVAASTAQRFHVAMNQITQMTLFPRMMQRILVEAPNCEIHATPIDSDSLKGLNTGTLDLAIGDIVELHQGYFKRTVLVDEYVCLVSGSHPRIQGAITQQQFLQEAHVVVSGAGSIMRSADSWMDRRKIVRSVRVQVPDFLGIDSLVANSELLATVPRTLAKMFAASRRVSVLEHPYPLPKSTAKIYWHERNHRDGAQVWLRQLVVDTLLRHGADTSKVRG